MCERCFAQVPAGEAVCPECGAPMTDDPTVNLYDTAASADLSQANLLRVRGEYDQAEQRCLSILKRLPNDPGAHALLGDICADQGELDRAAEWYELALDLSPNQLAYRKKLEDVRARVAAKEEADTVEQIGLPTPSNRTPLIAGAVVGGVLLLALIGYALNRPRPTAPKPIDVTIAAQPPLKSPTAEGATPTEPTVTSTPEAASTPSTVTASPTTTPSPAATVPTTLTSEDRTLLTLMQTRSAEGARVVATQEDPRTKSVTLTYTVHTGDDPRRVGAVLGRDLMAVQADPAVVTVRALEGDRLVYVADVPRAKLNATVAPSDPKALDAWAAGVVQNEWRTPSATGGDTGNTAPATPTPATSAGGTATTGTTGA